MYELRQSFKKQLKDLNYDHWHILSVLAAFDAAVAEDQQRQRRELARAGMIRDKEDLP